MLTWQEDESPFAALGKGLADRGLTSGTVGLDENMAFVFSEGIRAANPHLTLVSASPVTAGCRMIKDGGDAGAHALVEDAGTQAAAFHGLAHRPGMVDSVDGAHVIAMAVFLLATVGEADAQRSAEERRFGIVDAKGIAAEQGVDESAADERGKARDPARVDHHGSGYHHDFQLLFQDAAHQRGGLADRRFHLALGGNAIRHEGEGQTVALLGFRGDADAAHAHHDAVALAQIAQAAAKSAAFVDGDHGVHALVFGLDPLLPDAHVGAMVGGRVEVFGGAAVVLHGAQLGIAGIDGRAAQFEQAGEEPRQQLGLWRLHQHAQVRAFDIGAADAEFLYFEPAVILHDLVEDVFHDMGIDQVAFRFDHFVKWHQSFIVKPSFSQRRRGRRVRTEKRRSSRRGAKPQRRICGGSFLRLSVCKTFSCVSPTLSAISARPSPPLPKPAADCRSKAFRSVPPCTRDAPVPA